MAVRRSYRFPLRPTLTQVGVLAACLEDHRTLYNAALEHRRTAYAKAGVSVRYGDQSAELKHIRADDTGGQGRWSFSSHVGHVRVHQHRPVVGRVKTISVKREGSRWYVVVSCDDVPAAPLPATGTTAGIDLGVASPVTTSDGVHVANAGRELIAVHPAGTSRTCARCGHRAKDNRLTAFACTACGHAAHADVNAAGTILRAGPALRQAGEAA
ncbi:RNA-guided endonuclease InsQ/TnpB family protein [Nonomuraea salmonea]|uniref:RNA-guided endonuclease InsQ/TnpB family protein n=1 Tax=Nonomuraea salmonea TaxID=46181 RepID=A0ABV5NPW5_9ACTN